MISDVCGVLEVWFVASRGVGDSQLVQHAHEDDVVDVRHWSTLFSDGVVRRRNVLFEQLH